MIHSGSESFDRILSFIDDVPVIDCHEHMAGPDFLVRYSEPIAALIAGYYSNDLVSAGLKEKQLVFLRDERYCHRRKMARVQSVLGAQPTYSLCARDQTHHARCL